MSYPDLIEEADGRFYITETQKTVARVHEIPAELLRGLFGQFTNGFIHTNRLLLALPAKDVAMTAEHPLPRLPDFLRRQRHEPNGTEDLRAGFSVEVAVEAGPSHPSGCSLTR